MEQFYPFGTRYASVWRRVVAGVLLGYAAPMFAQHLLDISLPPPKLPPIHRQADVGLYLTPNEMTPRHAIPIWQRAPNGVYIAVGFERGFIGVSKTPNAEFLITIDSDPYVTRATRINAALLAIAKDGDVQDYRYLRTQASWQEIQNRIAALAPESTTYRVAQVLTNKWEFDDIVAGRIRCVRNFRFFHPPPSQTGYFVDANYLYDTAQFSKLQKMARSGRIVAFNLNLSDQTAITSLVTQLAKKGLSVSVLDLSNTWLPGYVPPKNFGACIETFRKIATSDTILMLTKETERHVPDSSILDFDFFGFRFGFLNKHNVLLMGHTKDTDPRSAVEIALQHPLNWHVLSKNTPLDGLDLSLPNVDTALKKHAELFSQHPRDWTFSHMADLIYIWPFFSTAYPSWKRPLLETIARLGPSQFGDFVAQMIHKDYDTQLVAKWVLFEPNWINARSAELIRHAVKQGALDNLYVGFRHWVPSPLFDEILVELIKHTEIVSSAYEGHSRMVEVFFGDDAFFFGRPDRISFLKVLIEGFLRKAYHAKHNRTYSSRVMKHIRKQFLSSLDDLFEHRRLNYDPDFAKTFGEGIPNAKTLLKTIEHRLSDELPPFFLVRWTAKLTQMLKRLSCF